MTGRRIFGEKRLGGGRRAAVGLMVIAAAGALWLGLASRIHVNASWSDGAWGYLALPYLGTPEIGDLVLFDPPEGLGAGVPYLKTVRGLPGMSVSIDADGTVSLDGAPVARAKSHALDGRPLEAIGPGIIPPGHYYLHGEHADSHDSRYAEIGLVRREQITALAAPLPDIPWLGLAGPLVGPEDSATAETRR